MECTSAGIPRVLQAIECRGTSSSRSGVAAQFDRNQPFAGGLGTLDDVARAALFLASSDADWTTGVILDVADGAVMVR